MHDWSCDIALLSMTWLHRHACSCDITLTCMTWLHRHAWLVACSCDITLMCVTTPQTCVTCSLQLWHNTYVHDLTPQTCMTWLHRHAWLDSTDMHDLHTIVAWKLSHHALHVHLLTPQAGLSKLSAQVLQFHMEFLQVPSAWWLPLHLCLWRWLQLCHR